MAKPLGMTPLQLAEVLHAMPPRAAAALQLRLVAGVSREGCAERYGISPQAFDVLMLRAWRDFEATLQGAPAAAPRPDEQERQEAAALAGQLEGAGSALEPLRTHAPEVRAHLEVLEAAAANSPARHREHQLRRVALVLILGLTALTLWRQSTEPRPLSVPRPGTRLPGAPTPAP